MACFTDQENDPESGLMYYGARYYDPWVGRFLSQDPDLVGPSGGASFAMIAGNPGNFNGYSYALNAPTRYTDPTGRSPIVLPMLVVPNNKGSTPSAGGGSFGRSAGTKRASTNGSGTSAEKAATGTTQHAAQKAMIPRVEEGEPTDTEYFGYLLREGDSVIAAEPVAGVPGSGSVSPPPIPPNAIGEYHTQGALDSGSERPSIQDHGGVQGRAHDAYEEYGTQTWDAFIGTPGNRFWRIYYDRRSGYSSERMIGPLDPSKPILDEPR